MSTLLDDLDDLAQLHELAPAVRERCRAHAQRLREEMANAQRSIDHGYPASSDDGEVQLRALTRINGGAR